MAFSDSFKDLILDSIGEGVFSVDKKFKIVFFNRAAERITGYSREEVLDKFCKHIFKSHNCSVYCPIARVLETDKNLYDFESSLIGKDGMAIPVKLNSSILRDENNIPIGGIVSFRKYSEIEMFSKKLEKSPQYYGVIGVSKVMQDIFALIEEISESGASVFIRGESGTGKEMIADAIMKSSPRKDKPYIKVNCSVFPSTLLASELFGHVKGSFTDALKDRKGRFELADTGTIFLDEIGEIPLQTQIQLLRVLQEGTFERIGESEMKKVDVRVIAATNIHIENAIKKGAFREDLYYRLNVIPIEIPPLRERKEDIPYLIEHFLEKYALIYKKDAKELSDATMDLLLTYNWPGNVRELENIIEYLFVRTGDEQIIEDYKLPPSLKITRTHYSAPMKNLTNDDSDEKAQLISLLEANHWNRSVVAEKLNIGRTTLWRKMKKYGIE